MQDPRILSHGRSETRYWVTVEYGAKFRTSRTLEFVRRGSRLELFNSEMVVEMIEDDLTPKHYREAKRVIQVAKCCAVINGY